MDSAICCINIILTYKSFIKLIYFFEVWSTLDELRYVPFQYNVRGSSELFLSGGRI